MGGGGEYEINFLIQEPSQRRAPKTYVKTNGYEIRSKKVLAIRHIFSLVDMITNTKFSNCPYVFKIGVVQQ